MKSMYRIIEKIICKYGIIIEFILALLFWTNILNIFYNLKYVGATNYLNIFITSILLVLIIFLLIVQTKKFYNKIEKMFLIYIIPIGIAFLIFVLPNYAFSETIGISRAYDITNGNFLPEKNSDNNAIVEVPKQYYQDNNMVQINTYENLVEILKEKTNYDETVKYKIGLMSNSFLPYALTSIVFYFSRIINLNFFIAIYLARILNFIVFLICGYYAIKIIPFGKLVVFVYLAIPMVIHQAVSISIEALQNSCTILFIAYNLYLFKTDVKLTKLKIILYYILSIFLITAKFTYFPILFISLLIFGKKNITYKFKVLFFISIILITGIRIFYK